MVIIVPATSSSVGGLRQMIRSPHSRRTTHFETITRSGRQSRRDAPSVTVTMDSSWLGLDDFFSSSSRLSSRHSRISFGPRDLSFDTSTLRDSLLREFDAFPRRAGSRLKSRRERREETTKEERVEEEVSRSAGCEACFNSRNVLPDCFGLHT